MLARWVGRDVTLLQSLYQVTITMSTIGYEDLLDSKRSSLLMGFNIVAILMYMVVVAYTISNFTAFLVEGRLNEYFLTKRMQKRIGKMEQHYIVCGVKDIGVFVAHELHETSRPFVVIDKDMSAIEALRKDIPSLAYIEGDATDDHALLEAGVKNARAVVACLENDKENLYLALTAKELNSCLVLAAKYDSPKSRRSC